MTRRGMMAMQGGEPVNPNIIEWDYTEGLPSGKLQLIEQAEATINMTSDGLFFETYGDNYTGIGLAPNYQRGVKIIEATVSSWNTTTSGIEAGIMLPLIHNGANEYTRFFRTGNATQIRLKSGWTTLKVGFPMQGGFSMGLEVTNEKILLYKDQNVVFSSAINCVSEDWRDRPLVYAKGNGNSRYKASVCIKHVRVVLEEA